MLLSSSYNHGATILHSTMLINDNEFVNFRDDDYKTIYGSIPEYVCGTNRAFKTNPYAYDI